VNVDSGWARVNGTRLYYEVAGAGMPVVLIHGFSLDRRMWDEQFDALAERYHVVRYDLRGFGRSALPGSEPYSPAEDINALLGHLGLSRAVLVGLSLGGWVAVNCAVRYPPAVRALVLADAVLLGRNWSAEYHAAMSGIWAEARLVDVQVTKQRWLHSRLFQPGLADSQAGPRLARIVGEYSGWHFLNDDPDQMGTTAAEQLTAIRAPTLVVVGEHDLPDFHDIAADLQRQIPGARRECLSAAGHMSNMEAPERFNALLLEFLSQF
jgi:3-oxoadipate enol-lactonase